MRYVLNSALLAVVLAVVLSGQTVDQFFIVSSVNPTKQQLLVKQPTEVTQLMRVDERTKYFDRNGKSIGLTDLRAGDTVFVVLRANSDIAREIRKGPMTVAELTRRYLRR